MNSLLMEGLEKKVLAIFHQAFNCRANFVSLAQRGIKRLGNMERYAGAD